MMKKKNYLSIFIMVIFVLSVFSFGASAAEVGGDWRDYASESLSGSGTVDDPFLIQSEEDLAYLSKSTTAATDRYKESSNANYLKNQFFKITAEELDMSAHYWTPAKFNGYLEGSNCVIKGLTVNITSTYNLMQLNTGGGLFSELNAAKAGRSTSGLIASVQNLHFENPNISSTVKGAYGGVLAGYVRDVYVSNCTVTGGSVSGFDYSGGLIGAIVPSDDRVDAFVINSCSSTADVSALSLAGGIVGRITGKGSANENIVSFENCWTSGAVSVSDPQGYFKEHYSGGIVGHVGYGAYGVELENCFSLCDVTGENMGAGGLIGFARPSGMQPFSGEVIIRNSVALNSSLSSTMEGTVDSGRIISTGASIANEGKGTFANNYGLDVMTVIGNYAKDDENANGTGVSRETISNRYFWENTVGFDFSEQGAWAWDDAADANSYPTLKKDMVNRMSLFFSMQPHDATQYKQNPAVFAVIPTGGAVGYRYLWYVKADEQADWQEITDATSSTLQISEGYDSGAQFRCTVTDQAGQSVVSDAAVLTVTASKYTPEDAVNDLNSYYQEKGNISHAKEAFSLSSLKSDLSNYTIDLPFYETYTARYNASEENTHMGYFPWSLLDSYALGIDPHYYMLVDGEYTRIFNLINLFLNQQNPETGNIYHMGNYYPMHEEDLPVVILGLEMYFDGGAWGNESEGTKLGRDGAIEYFFNEALVEYEESRGLGLKHSYYTQYSLKTIKTNIRIQRSTAEAAILAARLVDDPKWGEQAEEALAGLMKTLEYFYDTREENADVDSFIYTESQARYVSALIAAGNVTDNYFKKIGYFNLADDIVKNNADSLLKSKAIDGSYGIYAGQSTIVGDADATAAVMMALADYENQSSILMDYVFEISDEAAVANDLAEIEINSPVTGDLELATSGIYGSEITWETSDKSVISVDGKVNRSDVDVTVTLIATATKGDAVATRSFELVVKAKVNNAEEDAVDAVLAGLNVPVETTHDITLDDSNDESVALTWESSDENIIALDGKVTRPAVGSDDAVITLKATASKGESLSKSKEFIVKVYAETNDSLIESYYFTREKYLSDRSLNGYWQIWAAYAALGDYITDPANGYVFGIASPASDWYGTQYGVNVSAIVIAGENPYDYRGTNWVELLQKHYGGPFAGPVFSELGMETAGAGSKYYTPSASAGISGTAKESMTQGIDVAGWAAVVLAAHHGEADADAAAKTFIDLMKNTYGVSENGNFSTPDGKNNVNFISTGCGIMGLASLYSVGYTDADVTSWANAVSGKTPVDAVYHDCFIEQKIPGYDEQIETAICDLYNAKYLGGTSTWISCRVSGEKLAAQETAANEILANKEAYEAESIAAIEAALAVTAEISEERRNADIVDFGEEYYALYDAVRYAELIGQAEKDAEAAAVVSERLNALGDDITLDDKSAVEAARAAYDALSAKQKALVDEAALAKLTDAEAVIKAIESANDEATKAEADKAAAKAVKDIIDALPAKKDILSSDASAVEAARAAYDALTDAQKAFVSEKTVAKLEAAEARIAALGGMDVVDIANMTDVSEDNWFYDDVAYVLGNGLFKGMSATTFGANEPMTRAQFVTVLGRYAGVEDSSAAYPQQTIFNDVDASSYYASHVKWATDNGITVGTSATTFCPDANITRQDMSVMMLRFAKVMGIVLPKADSTLFADDADISDYAKEAVYRMKAAGILQGKGDNMFMPKDQSKRSEVAAVLHRFFTMEEPVDSVVVSVEKFTLGQGYIVEPTVVELEEGDTAADVLLRLLEDEGIEYNASYSSGTFYLSGIKDNDNGVAVIPRYILDKLGGVAGERDDAGWLKGFDYGPESGWMFWQNNSEPMSDNGSALGAGQTVLSDGDVIRWQFSIIGMGRDLGCINYEDAYIANVDKDALTAAVAKAADKTTKAYNNALEVLMNMESTRAEVDAALEALK